MKRKDHLFEQLISDENLRLALQEVNKSHRWNPNHVPNRTVRRVEADTESYVQAMREILLNGFKPCKPRISRRWDKSAGKWRDISEPRLWPDQYIHHAIVQVLQPVMMRGMDHYCCGSIKGRGIHYGMKAIQRWMREDAKRTEYCLELDIRHFYDSLRPEIVVDRMRQLIKDEKMISVIENTTQDGILIGAYFSQWFANTTLQPLDQIIRASGAATHYVRYMDNFTIFGSNKRKLHKLLNTISAWLNEHDLEVKHNWQVFPTRCRMPSALGYRYGHGYTFLRKRNLLRLKRQLSRCRRMRNGHKRIFPRFASGLLSRIGQLRHCNSVQFYALYIIKGLQKFLKKIVRKEQKQWNTSLATTAKTKLSKPLDTSTATLLAT